jgi:hypothetical protein
MGTEARSLLVSEHVCHIASQRQDSGQTSCVPCSPGGFRAVDFVVRVLQEHMRMLMALPTVLTVLLAPTNLFDSESR